MTLQEQLRKLTTGGPGVTHIATETLFEDAATALDAHDRIIQSWKREEAEWIAERDALAADNAALRVEIAQWRAERDALAAEIVARNATTLELTTLCADLRTELGVYKSTLATCQDRNARAHAETRAAEARVAKLGALVHRACNTFENITVADTLEIARDRAHHGVSLTMERSASETPAEASKAQFVCDLKYAGWANALADCKRCGWPISRHFMVDDSLLNTKGPFAPSTSEPETKP